MKDNKKLKIYISIFITIIIIAGVSYAYFFLRKEQTNDNVIGTRTCLDTTLNEQTSRILLEDAIPISDKDGLNQTPFTFSVTNNCDSYVKLTITIENENRESTSTSLLNDNLIKINLSPKGTTTGTSKLLGILTLTDIEAGRKGYIISETGLKGGETKEYDLRTWMDSNTTLDEGLGKSWEGKIVIIVNAEEEPITWENPGKNTLLAAIKNSNTVSKPLTTPGVAISTASEAILASTADDYGTSYYFRGAVTNNYVQFANKCWRIVRVGGDGSVKLILHNDNTAGAANPCNSANNSASAAFAHYDGDTYKSAFNANYNDNAYVGFKYGTPGSNKYETTHANTNNSTILTNLEAWYNNNDNFKKYEKVIADTVWCNDKTNVTDTTYDPFGEKPNGLGYAKNVTYYGAAQRLMSPSNSAGGTGPSLKCNGELSKITSKVGLITADELAFAGYAYGLLVNSTTYLQENATDGFWWSLSPVDFDGYHASVWVVGTGNGNFVGGSLGGYTHGVRPSLSLKSTVPIASGKGTRTSPYIIK